MPAGYAHEVCARAALAWLSPGDREIIEWNFPAYLLGAQGPDILYFYGILPPWRSHEPNRIGAALHRQSGAIMTRELLLRGRGAEPAAAAWALGYLCHWMADASIHPYLLATAHANEQPHAHGLIEQSIDTGLYQRTYKGIPEPMAFLRELPRGDAHAIAVLFASVTRQALPRRQLTARQIETAIADAARVHHFLHSPNGKRHRHLTRLEQALKRPNLLTSHLPPPTITGDPLNLAHANWKSPASPSRYRSESLPELLEQASKATARAIEATLACWDGRSTLDEALDVMGSRRMEDGE